jgi:hypothetical protein
MLHYKGLVSSPWITIKPSEKSNMNTVKTLEFYDDELPEKSCYSVREKLQEHYSADALIHVYYEKEKNYSVIEISKYFNENDDLSRLVSEYKSSFEEYYKKTFSNSKKMKNKGMTFMSGTDEWKVVIDILKNVLNEEDSEKLAYALKTSVKHEVEQILENDAKKNRI